MNGLAPEHTVMLTRMYNRFNLEVNMSMTEPQTSKLKSLIEEVGMVGLVLSFIGANVTLSSLTVFLAKLFGLPGREELNPILDVLFTSFPLTVAAAVVFVYYRERKLTLLNAIYILAGAVLGGSLLNIVLDLGMPSVPFRTDFFGPFGIGVSYLSNYITMYGPFPFIQSCVLGYFFGKWYRQLTVVAST